MHPASAETSIGTFITPGNVSAITIIRSSLHWVNGARPNVISTGDGKLFIRTVVFHR